MKNLNLKDEYEKTVIPQLMKELAIKNRLAVPRVEKVIVNMGVGDVFRDRAKEKQVVDDLAAITGQKPAVRAAKISVAGFNVRRGMPVGLKVTLRGKRMYDFLQKLFAIVLPRLRDFRGLPLKGFDRTGNYTLGISEHTVFPEIDLSKAVPHGLEITIVTNANDKEKSKKLLTLLGMPFEKEEEKD